MKLWRRKDPASPRTETNIPLDKFKRRCWVSFSGFLPIWTQLGFHWSLIFSNVIRLMWMRFLSSTVMTFPRRPSQFKSDWVRKKFLYWEKALVGGFSHDSWRDRLTGYQRRGPGYHTCGNIKGKEKNSQKGKREKGGKGNFLRFISTVIFPMIKKSRNSFEKYIVHCITFT